MCTAKFAKWASAAEKETAFSTCNAVTDLTKCNENPICEGLNPKFDAYGDWRNLVSKAGL